MNKEEIEEIETLEIDFKDTDELELALEVSSKKAIYLIDDLIKHLFELQQENQKLENQQKEFIEYLEKEKDRCLTFYSSAECMYAYDVFKDVLSKYKDIIDKLESGE